MSKLPSMPLFPADFFADTAHISGEAAGVYLLMLGHAWMSNKAELPADDEVLTRMLRINRRRWNVLKHEVLPFWELADGKVYKNHRLTKDRQNIDEKTTINRRNGALGGRPKLHQNSLDFNGDAKPNGFSSHNPNKSEPKGNQNQNQNHKKSFLNGGSRQEGGWVPTKRVDGKVYKVGEFAPAYAGQPVSMWRKVTPEDCV